MSDLDVDLYTWVILPLLIFTVQVVDVTLGTYTLPSWLSGSCRDGWKDMGVWGGRSPPHTPNFLPLPAIPKEPPSFRAAGNILYSTIEIYAGNIPYLPT